MTGHSIIDIGGEWRCCWCHSAIEKAWGCCWEYSRSWLALFIMSLHLRGRNCAVLLGATVVIGVGAFSAKRSGDILVNPSASISIWLVCSIVTGQVSVVLGNYHTQISDLLLSSLYFREERFHLITVSALVCEYSKYVQAVLWSWNCGVKEILINECLIILLICFLELEVGLSISVCSWVVPFLCFLCVSQCSSVIGVGVSLYVLKAIGPL